MELTDTADIAPSAPDASLAPLVLNNLFETVRDLVAKLQITDLAVSVTEDRLLIAQKDVPPTPYTIRWYLRAEGGIQGHRVKPGTMSIFNGGVLDAEIDLKVQELIPLVGRQVRAALQAAGITADDIASGRVR